MKFINPLPFVTDMERSKIFYVNLLKLKVVEDHGDFVKFDNGFALHEGTSLLKTIFGQRSQEDKPYGRQNLVLYFEVEDINQTFTNLKDQINLIHPVEQQAWGQHVFRCYDPDKHIVEIGEIQS